ncbi:hypothetical protein NHX12_014435 [Muraenolepis orangiensis]|uniref:Sex hormone-binding globulin n=1 Tax=Muraenolepis orangiensis TaxID=630683 RepID=A0A9Q0I6U0_9TELE|nr:hypothetical protein NHX12_014435 [Muraenolepis orangiensis]
MYLGQQTNTWRPLVKTTANLTDVQSLKSTFEFRTFDPEGVLFYGDNHSGEEWFVLALNGGVPEMQIVKVDILVSVSGGPRLDDGLWHLMAISTEGKFVLLEVDGSKALMVGLHSQMVEEFRPAMDGCVRGGRWLDLTTPWEMEEEGVALRPCWDRIQRGSYFPGSGFAVFNTSALNILDGEDGVKIRVEGELAQMDGTVLSIRGGDQTLILQVEITNSTQTILVKFGSPEVTREYAVHKIKALELTIYQHSLLLWLGDPLGDPAVDSFPKINQNVGQNMLSGGRLAIGGLLGEGEDAVGSNFLVGCLEKISVHGKQLDLDLAAKDASISSYSCPVR